jgi:hypothetical protein
MCTSLQKSKISSISAESVPISAEICRRHTFCKFLQKGISFADFCRNLKFLKKFAGTLDFYRKVYLSAEI